MRNPIKYFFGLEHKDKLMLFVFVVAASNIILALYNLVFGILNMSLWMLINAVFYGIVAFSRYLSVRYYGRLRRAESKSEMAKLARADYRNSGILLIFLALIYVGVSIYMFNSASEHNIHEYAIYGTAFMAFWSLGFSIAGIMKYKKNTNLVVRATVITNCAVAITAIVATQEILLSRFGGGENYSMVNGLVGFAASFIIFVMGIGMLVAVNNKKHKL